MRAYAREGKIVDFGDLSRGTDAKFLRTQRSACDIGHQDGKNDVTVFETAACHKSSFVAHPFSRIEIADDGGGRDVDALFVAPYHRSEVAKGTCTPIIDFASDIGAFARFKDVVIIGIGKDDIFDAHLSGGRKVVSIFVIAAIGRLIGMQRARGGGVNIRVVFATLVGRGLGTGVAHHAAYGTSEQGTDIGTTLTAHDAADGRTEECAQGYAGGRAVETVVRIATRQDEEKCRDEEEWRFFHKRFVYGGKA